MALVLQQTYDSEKTKLKSKTRVNVKGEKHDDVLC